MNWEFAYPWVLILGAFIPLIWIVQVMVHARRRGMASSVPSRIAAAGGSMRTLTAWLPGFIISISIAMLIIAIARPQEILDHTKTKRDAIALELVVDRSGSMDDVVVFNGDEMSRLEAVKVVLEEFVVGDGDELSGREGDLLGLIVFGSFADTLMPLTQSHESLVEAIRTIQTPRKEQERSTAIGDALMLAIARLKASEDSMRKEMNEPEFTLKSKAVILLTDGDNRTGTYSPKEAAELAKEWGIKLYVISVKGKPMNNINQFLFGRQRQMQSNGEMQRVVEDADGQFWSVDSLSDLRGVYAQIDELERSTIEISESTSYRELYLPFAMIGFGAYIGTLLLKAMLYRGVI
ncbi:MAG: VWA domain-containing protein [Phycisphaerales bacterium]|nr:VWA domain-containing protein [Phycisphaerales bacterium]